MISFLFHINDAHILISSTFNNIISTIFSNVVVPVDDISTTFNNVVVQEWALHPHKNVDKSGIMITK